MVLKSILNMLNIVLLIGNVSSEPDGTTCQKLKDHITFAEAQTNFGQTKFIHEHDYTKVFIYSDVFLKLSKYAASEFILNGASGQFLNLNPELAKYSVCIRTYLNSVCTPNNAVNCPLPWYRPFDGICCNIHAAKDGASGTSYSSILYPHYDDGVSEIKRSIQKPNDLPSPRLVSVSLFGSDCKNITVIYQDGPTQGGVMFSQLIAHDVSMGTNPGELKTGPRKCCKDNGSGALEKPDEDCAAIIAPQNDSILSPINRLCFGMVRLKNVYDNDCNLSMRKPMNLQTASPDLSIIYGPTKNQSEKVRTFNSGLIFDNAKRNFFSFDLRAGQTPQLAVLHSIFIRLHYLLINLLRLLDPLRLWGDEKLYQEARRFNVAFYQSIIFNEWLPIFIDKKYIKLRFSKCSNDTLASNIEFAHSMFRHLHTFIPETFQLYNNNYVISLELFISDIIGHVELLDSSYDNMVRGFFMQPINFNGCHDQIINRLFKDGTGVGIDLLAIDIQRARETGVQGYVSYANKCLDKDINTFEDLAPEISNDNIEKLKQLYTTVHDVDLYAGAKLEIVEQKFKFGPTLSCIIGDQFARYKYCDRYFYNNVYNPKPFGLLQLAQIEKITFAQILCAVTDIKRVSINSFRTLQGLVDCNLMPKLVILPF